MDIRIDKPRKNKFDLSREVKMTGNMGTLMPCFIQDVVPGDAYRVNTQQMIRFSPLLAPVMHNIDFKIDYFFVPYRLIWSEWKDFITRGEQGLANEQPSYPRFKVKQDLAQAYFQKGQLADYLGIPPLYSNCEGSTNEKKEAGAWTGIAQNNTYLSILPFRAYQLIYHEYFRDQNVGYEVEQYDGSGIRNQNNSMNDEIVRTLSLRFVNWEKDYFTSALPFLQRGPEVELP